jgi:hypothetical protein
MLTRVHEIFYRAAWVGGLFAVIFINVSRLPAVHGMGCFGEARSVWNQ